MKEKIYMVEEFVEEIESLNEETKVTGEYWTNNYRMLLQYRNTSKSNTWKDLAWTTPKLTSRYAYKKIRDKEYLINEDEEVIRYVINDRVRPVVMKYLEPEGNKPEVHTDYVFPSHTDKEVKHVCPRCFREECICPKDWQERRKAYIQDKIEEAYEKYEDELTEEDFKTKIDANILPLIQLLNDKGYGTQFCCEGHPINFYINFKNDFEELKDCPIRNIKVVRKEHHGCYNKDGSKHYDYIFYRNITFRAMFEFEQVYPGIAEMLKRELLEDLMMWAETLPHAKVNWMTDCCYICMY